MGADPQRFSSTCWGQFPSLAAVTNAELCCEAAGAAKQLEASAVRIPVSPFWSQNVTGALHLSQGAHRGSIHAFQARQMGDEAS